LAVNYVSDFQNPVVAFLQIWVRRGLSIALYSILCMLFVVTLPGLLLLTFLIDLGRGKHWIFCRCVLFFSFYFCCEMAGIVASFFLWLAHLFRRDAEKFLGSNFALQKWWANALAQGCQKIFGMRLAVEGKDELTRGPVIVFARHVSVADSLLPAFFIANPNGLRLRYVLKRQLLWDPCLDIVGNRLPNCFVRRDAGEAQVVNRLMANLSPRDGVIIFPEGTRFTEAKRAKILARLQDKGEIRFYEKASALKRTLPPRLGGALNLLAQNENADVIFCAHAGFDSVLDLRDFFNGSLVRRTVRVRFRRVPFADIPKTREAQTDWLLDCWKEIDDWIGIQLGETNEVVDAN
jgi:1-acyl-sn-glycerol-3-phosphate acyltransferase